MSEDKKLSDEEIEKIKTEDFYAEAYAMLPDKDEEEIVTGDIDLDEDLNFQKKIPNGTIGGYEPPAVNGQIMGGYAPTVREFLQSIDTEINTIQNFWLNRLEKGIILKTHDHWEERVRFDHLYAEYVDFTNGLESQAPVRSSDFSKQLDKICGGIKTFRKSIGGKKYRFKYFPTLKESRKEFEEAFAIKTLIKWR